MSVVHARSASPATFRSYSAAGISASRARTRVASTTNSGSDSEKLSIHRSFSERGRPSRAACATILSTKKRLACPCEVNTELLQVRSTSRPLGRLPCHSERYRSDRRDARRVGLSRRILKELRDDPCVARGGACVVALVRKLDEVRVTERGGDAASQRCRRSVVEVASQDQRRNAAPHRRRHRCIAPVWKPLLAFPVNDAPEWRSRDCVDRIEGPPVNSAGGRVVGTVDERAPRTVRSPLGTRSDDLAGRPRAVTGAQLVEQQRETGDAHAEAIEHAI